MSKAPAFQFYVRDWLSDPELQMTSSATRGVWINALCFMWESKERGKLEGTMEELAKILNSTNGDFEQFLKDVETHKFCDVRICNTNVTLINRRMYREQKERENTRLRVARLRSNAKCNASVTVLSSSSSSLKENIIKEKTSFGEFQNVKLTDSEYQKLLSLFGPDQCKEKIETLSQYIASKGKKYSSHYATILSWERKNKNKNSKSW